MEPTVLEIVLTIIGMIGAAFGWLAQKHAKEANKAVNGNKNPEAIRLYDLVVRVDERADRFDSWMIRHKTEAAERDDRIVALGERLEGKIAEYGCPIRLGYTLQPLCGSELHGVIAEVAETKVKKEADRVAIELQTTAENAARILAAKKPTREIDDE